MGGMGEPYERSQSEKDEARQQKGIVHRQEGRLLHDVGSELAHHHVWAEARRFELIRELLHQIEGRKPPSAEMIRQIELMKRRAPIQYHPFQGDAESAGGHAQKPRLVRGVVRVDAVRKAVTRSNRLHDAGAP